MEKCALYLRLSKDDNYNKDSESIINQKIYLTEYCKRCGYEICGIYSDDGYSGTDFERPAFIRMMSDADNKKFDTIITKDMSRLGRDYIKTGEYIEKIFPEKNIRYIAVNDGVDTRNNTAANEMIPFRAVLNDMYAKDISRKVRTSLDQKRKAGLFIGNTAPFGYKKDADNKGKIIIDDGMQIRSDIYSICVSKAKRALRSQEYLQKRK